MAQYPLDLDKHIPHQGVLFGNELPRIDQNTGYRAPVAAAAVGVSYRQLDYWARTGLVEPSVRDANGSGSQRLYSFRDILALKIVKRLLDSGVSLQQIRKAIKYLDKRGIDDLSRVTLMSDGASIYECTSRDEICDLMLGGQGVFGIAIEQVWREVEGQLCDFPTEKAGNTLVRVDELAIKRRQRYAG